MISMDNHANGDLVKPASAADLEKPGQQQEKALPPPLTWEYDIPLLTNPFILWDFFRVFAIALLTMEGLVLFMSFFFSDEAVLLPVELLALCLGIMAVLFAFVALFIYRNRFHSRFTVDSKQASVEGFYGIDRYERTASRILSVAFFLTRGRVISLIGDSQSATSIPWQEVYKVTVHRRWHVITLSNSWRSVLRLYCPSQGFDQAAALMQDYAAAAARRRSRHPTPPLRRRSISSYLAWTGLSVVATIASSAWYWAGDEVLKLSLLAGILVLIVGWTSSFWWSKLIAWPAVGVSLIFLARLVPPALEETTFSWRGTAYGYEFDTPLLLVTVAGGLSLLALSVLSLRTRK